MLSSRLLFISFATVLMVCDSAPAFAGMITPIFEVLDDPFTISVKNTTSDPAVLDDLTVYDATKAQSMVILKKGSATHFSANQVQMFDNITFKPASIEASLPNGTKTTTIFKLGAVTEDVSMLINPGDNSPLFLAIDTSQANSVPPAVGTILTYTNGLNATTPGWFVGTTIDDSTGDITNPYSGSAEVFSNTFAISVLAPEPSSIGLVVCALGTLAWMKRRSQDFVTRG